MTNRLFAYNPTGDPIDGCETYGTLAVSVTEQAYCDDIGGIKWWGGPDEDLGYIVAKVIPPNDQPTEVPGLTGDVAFNRSIVKTEESFLDMVRIAFGQTFGSGDDAKTWLNNNNHWTNWGLSSSTPTPTPAATSTPTPVATSTPTPTPTTSSLFTDTVDYAVNAYNACWNKIGSINVTGDGTTFCNSSNYTAAAFASLSTGNYVLSYLGNTVNISVTFGSPNAVMYGGGCQTCPAQ